MSEPYDWHEHVPTLKDILIGCTVYAAVLAILVLVCSLRGNDIAPEPAVAVGRPDHGRPAPADRPAADDVGDIASSRLSDGRY